MMNSSRLCTLLQLSYGQGEKFGKCGSFDIDISFECSFGVMVPQFEFEPSIFSSIAAHLVLKGDQ